MRHTRFAFRGVLGVVAAATLLGPAADAQEPPARPVLGGFQGSAAATVVRAFYNGEGILPVGAILELGIPDALATIASGPSTFARAAAADPGDLLANPDALLQQAGQTPGTLPAWPFRISASSGVGEPTAELSPAPGIDSRVSATDTESSAFASMPGLTAPAVLTAGSAVSRATTSTDGSTVTVHARSELSGIDLLGLLRIDSVVTDLTAVADGTNTSVTGGTVVTGATLLGQPVTIDSDGMRPAQPGVGALNDTLAALGIHVTVASPVEQGEAVAGQLTAAGLRIDLELSDATFPVIDDLLDLLPPVPPLVPGAPGLDDVLAVARARHLVSLGIGGASVSLVARVPGARPGLSPTSPTIGGALLPSAVAAPPAPPSLVAVPAGAAPQPETPSAGLAQGIGALAIIVLLVQPFIGERLATGAELLLAGGPAEACPREGT